MASACLPGPAPDSWRQVLQQLQLSREQLKAVVAARKSLLVELQRVAAEWQKVLPTLALQLLQVRHYPQPLPTGLGRCTIVGGDLQCKFSVCMPHL